MAFWVKQIVKYVPVPSWGRYDECWSDRGYVNDAISVGDNKVFQVEVTNLIKKMRDMADTASSPEALKAYNACIDCAKGMLVLTPIARQRLDDLNFIEESRNG